MREERNICLFFSCHCPQLFVQALFDYDPNEDPTVPCKEAAVAFKRGDILQVVNREDDTWWQACSLRSSDTHAGLIPSQRLHERYPPLFDRCCKINSDPVEPCFDPLPDRRVALQRPRSLFKPRRVKPPVAGENQHLSVTAAHFKGVKPFSITKL